MRVVTAEDVRRALPYPTLVDAIEEAFRADVTAPVRHHHTLPQPGGENATLLLMPAWTESGERFLGCKIVTVFPGNAARKKPSVYGSYLLLSGATGEPLAIMDGRELTARRTAAASAVAAKYLARTDTSHLLMIGAGTLSEHLIRAHAAVRPIRRVTLWNRTRERAEALAGALLDASFAIEVAFDLPAKLGEADVVSCATMSNFPLVNGASLKPGAHVDLVGGYTPAMREADDEAVRRARVFVDTRAGALKEAGDVVDPIARGVIAESDIAGDLFDLCRGAVQGRGSAEEITLFKSVGAAIEDLAAAMLVWQSIR